MSLDVKDLKKIIDAYDRKMSRREKVVAAQLTQKGVFFCEKIREQGVSCVSYEPFSEYWHRTFGKKPPRIIVRYHSIVTDLEKAFPRGEKYYSNTVEPFLNWLKSISTDNFEVVTTEIHHAQWC